MGSSLRLPLVITSGRADAGQQQVVQRAVGQQHPELGQARRDRIGHGRAPARRGASTIGRRGDVSAAAATVVELAELAPPSSRSATITANGLSSRALRRRSSATAASSVASTARW